MSIATKLINRLPKEFIAVDPISVSDRRIVTDETISKIIQELMPVSLYIEAIPSSIELELNDGSEIEIRFMKGGENHIRELY